MTDTIDAPVDPRRSDADTERLTIIHNPAAGRAPSEHELRDAVGDAATLVATTEDHPGVGQAADAVRNGADVVVACGGDGTVRAVLESVVGSRAALAVLPFGTGNLLASNLGLPDGFEALEHIRRGVRRRIDTVEVNGESFAVMAGSGFDAEMMIDAPSALKQRMGTPAYVVSALRHLRDDRVSTTVEVDGAPWFHGPTAMVLVGNHGTISGGVEVFPDADPWDGRLDVMVVSAAGVRDWVRLAWRLLRGRGLSGAPAVRTSGASVVVTTSTPRRWELDGDERPPTDRLEFVIDPDSLEVVVGDA